MQMDTIQEMPLSHTKADITIEEVKMILEYNWHDVKATYQFYLKNIEAIQLRYNFKEKYNLNCINWNDVKLGSELLLDLYCKKTNSTKEATRERKTFRSKMYGKDIVFPYISFVSDEFNNLLKAFKNLEIQHTKNAFEFSVKYKGFQYDYGLGGLHGSIKPGTYESDNTFIIKDLDVSSLYPSIAVQNDLYPWHLGKIFSTIYRDEIVNVRLAEKAKPKNEQDANLIAAFKLSSNGVYGKSNEITSWLYDPLYTMKTTINGQLLLTMLAEDLVIQIPNLQIIQINTDGITVRVERQYETLYHHICKKFEENSRLTLEFVDYSKMVIIDVNNYLSVKLDGKVKYKGLFEIQKELHKNNSMMVVPKSLSEYFINGYDYKKYVREIAPIIDFCKGVKVKSNFKLNLHSVKNREHIIEPGEKVTRYYISTNGGNLCKEFNDGKKTDCESGWKTSMLQTIKNVDNINYDYYIKEVEKIIFSIEGNKLQTTLF